MIYKKSFSISYTTSMLRGFKGTLAFIVTLRVDFIVELDGSNVSIYDCEIVHSLYM